MFIPENELHRLSGCFVCLRLLTEAHRGQLRALARDERIWEFTKTLLITDSYDRNAS